MKGYKFNHTIFYPVKLEYQTNKRLAIELQLRNGISYAIITVNLPDLNCSYDCAFIDTNNVPWAAEFLEKTKIGNLIGIGYSGFCRYPLYKIDLNKLNEDANN